MKKIRKEHDLGCPWNYDRHNCSCGFLEEQIRTERKHKMEECETYLEAAFPCEECDIGEEYEIWRRKTTK